MSTDKTRPPAAFRLSDPNVLVEDPAAPADQARRKAPRPTAVVTPDLEDLLADVEAAPIAEMPTAPKRGFGWGRLFIGAAGSLVTFAVGIWVTDFIQGLFQRDDALGYIALALAAVAGLALLAIVLREIASLARLTRITRLRADAEAAAASDDRDAARAAVRATLNLYAGRPETARARAAVSEHVGEIIDGRDLLRLAERELMTRLDRDARAMITAAARRVSVVTAVSPRALIDVAYVVIETARLVRGIGTLYGGRPTGLAMLRLLKLAIAHLAVTSGVAITDGLVQQIVGHGIAARLSARLGEGVVNGMMTARVGLAALDVCRPLPWLDSTPPGLGEVMKVLVGTQAAKDKKGD
jgi:putative membrane protein